MAMFPMTLGDANPPPQTIPIFTFFVAFNIFLVLSKHRYFVFGLQVDRSYSKPTNNKLSLKGAWLRHVTRFKFLGPHIHISWMAKARALKLCTKGDYQVLPKGWQITLKGFGFANVTDFVCTTVDFKKISTALGNLRSTACPRRRTTDYRTFKGRCWCCHMPSYTKA